MADTHVTAHALDVILKLEAEQLATALSSYFGLSIPRIVRAYPTELSQLTLRTERLDTVFELDDDTLLHLEYQSEYRSDVLPRFLSYDVGLYQEHHRRIRTVVIYGPAVATAPASLDLISIHYTVENIFLGQRDGDEAYRRLGEQVARGEALDENDRLELVFLPLMAHHRSFEEIVTAALELARTLPEGQQQRAVGTLLALAYHYVGREAFDRLVEDLMATNVLESVLERSLRQGLERGMAQGLEQGREQGLEQGREQGLEQGREQGLEQGRAQARRDDILKVVSSRFGPLSESLVARISAISEPAQLDTLFDLSLSTPTLDDFSQALDLS